MGKADFIGMGRGSLADPDLCLTRRKAGDLTAIRYLHRLYAGCGFYGKLLVGESITCLVNPSLGQEYQLDYSKAAAPKKVLIAGGGPGWPGSGCAAAIKGHEVTLYEQGSFLGGQFKSAAYPLCKGELATYTNWITHELIS